MTLAQAALAPLPAAPAGRPRPDWPTLLPQLREAGARHDRDGSFPFDALDLLRQAGLLSLTVPVALGGQGGGLAASAEAVGLVAQGCASTALVLAMQCTKQAALARGQGYAAPLRERLGREAVQEGALVNAIRVEPELGSPTRGGLPATTARRVPGGWRVSGRKIYSTGAPGLTWFETFCRTDELKPRLGNFLIRAGSPGLRIVESWDHLGLRASGSHDVVLEDVFVPEEQAGQLQPAGEGPPPRDDIQAAWNAALLGALYTGVAVAARDWLLGFLRGRVPANLGQPLASLPRVQEAVGEITTLLTVNGRLLAGLAAETDAGNAPSSTEAGLLKVVLTRQAVDAVRLANGLASNHALSRHNPLERHWRDVQCGVVHVPQADSAMIAAGRIIL
ncbi:acyl-CoA/acyl-ACP dehydrogenase [Roseomonas sp. GC11]|uniref:acyl-CoA dehydrogenase family protein n=1 Tax=Roseomonas sp. GC11 TaxID=2950546 RepID=UPI002109D911|nr:acyl-CoA dehydrogenase family protein [Roseomonas sp. GC11]MCQ4159060.1 acyl-CoA/acyl-ACP dehydrogenase [Roseomonas sp. GC11]